MVSAELHKLMARTLTGDTNIPNSKITSSVNQADSATITITMRTPLLPDES